MSREAFDLTRKIAIQEYPDYESQYRALGAVDASEFDELLLGEINDASAFALWYAAQEAIDVDNTPMLNLIALAALKGVSSFRRQAYTADIQKSKTYDGVLLADNMRELSDNFQYVYDEIMSRVDTLHQTEDAHSTDTFVESLEGLSPQRLRWLALDLIDNHSNYAVKVAQVASFALQKSIAKQSEFRMTGDGSFRADAANYFEAHNQVLEALIFTGSVARIDSINNV